VGRETDRKNLKRSREKSKGGRRKFPALFRAPSSRKNISERRNISFLSPPERGESKIETGKERKGAGRGEEGVVLFSCSSPRAFSSPPGNLISGAGKPFPDASFRVRGGRFPLGRRKKGGRDCEDLSPSLRESSRIVELSERIESLLRSFGKDRKFALNFRKESKVCSEVSERIENESGERGCLSENHRE